MKKYLLALGGRGFYLVVFLRIIESSLGMFSLSLIFPLSSLLIDKEKFSLTVSSYIPYLDKYSDSHKLLFIGFLLSFYCFLRYLFGLFSLSFISGYLVKQRFFWVNKLTDFYLQVDYLKIKGEREGKLVSQWFNETYNASVFLSLLISIFNDITFIILFIIIVFSTSISLGIVLLLIFSLLLFYQIYLKNKNLNTQSTLKVEYTQSLMAVLTEVVMFFKDIRLFNLNSLAIKKVSQTTFPLERVLIANSEQAKKPSLFSELFIVFTISMLFLIIGSNLYKVNDLNFPLLITLLTFGFRSLGYFSQLVISYSKLKIEFKSFYEVVSKLNVINNSLHKNTQHSSFNPTNPPLSHIYIKNLSFSYFNNISILDNITVKIPLGGHIVVYGKSGSGKSTFLDILTGMIHTSKGQISLFDINGKSHANNSNLYAYVSQNVGLFGSNLKECICGEHKFDQVNFDNVVRICQLSKVLNQCETSFSMAKFSGGEKSRIALARAIYYQRQILILDESLSSVELSLEKKIIEEIKSEYPYITILQVLHERNSSIVPDYKLVFENSKVEVFKI